MTVSTTRRGFLKGVAAGSAVLMVGITPKGALAAGDSAMMNPFVKIGSDGTVTAIVKHFEKGQGPATGLSTLIAEEIDSYMHGNACRCATYQRIRAGVQRAAEILEA